LEWERLQRRRVVCEEWSRFEAVAGVFIDLKLVLVGLEKGIVSGSVCYAHRSMGVLPEKGVQGRKRQGDTDKCPSKSGKL